MSALFSLVCVGPMWVGCGEPGSAWQQRFGWQEPASADAKGMQETESSAWLSRQRVPCGASVPNCRLRALELLVRSAERQLDLHGRLHGWKVRRGIGAELSQDLGRRSVARCRVRR